MGVRKGPISLVSMFAAEWFEGFHEFHLGANPTSAKLQAFLWKQENKDAPLTQRELSQIYRQASHILTYYYDLSTHSEIFPWHHAAGDFVVSRQEDRLDVKLITVRQYAPRMVLEDGSQQDQLTALLMFLVNLTLRMRLDRDHGTGNIVWAPEHAITDAILGFDQALRDQVNEGRMDPAFLEQLIGFLRSIHPAELTRAFLEVLDSYSPAAPDIPVLTANLEQHIISTFKALMTVRLP